MNNMAKNYRGRAGPRRWAIRGIVALVLLVIVFIVGANFMVWRLTHFFDAGKALPDPSKMSLLQKISYTLQPRPPAKSRIGALPEFPYNDITLTTGDGFRLAGWLSRDPRATATVALFHGHGASRSSILPEAGKFREMGYRVLLVDFRAHGESTGNLCSIGYHEAQDVKAVWDYLSEHHPDSPVILYGVSMGAVSVARAVARFGLLPRGVILEMPYNRLTDAVRARVKMMGLPAEPFASVLNFWGSVQLGFSTGELCTADYVSRIKCPILLQWGDADDRVSLQEMQSIQARAAGKCSGVTVYLGGKHASLYKYAPQQWSETVEEFLRMADTENQK